MTLYASDGDLSISLEYVEFTILNVSKDTSEQTAMAAYTARRTLIYQ